MARSQIGLTPLFSLVAACVLWGVATVVSKHLLGSVPPLTFFVIQLVPSTIALWLLVLGRGVSWPGWRSLSSIALIGWINPGLSYSLSMLGLAQTTASVATLLWAAEPALILLMAWLVLREQITPRLVALAALAAAGVILVSGIATEGLAGRPAGAALILAGVACCALYTVLSRRIAGAFDPLFVVALQQSVGLLWALAIWPVELLGESSALAGLTPAMLAAAAFTGVMYYAAAFWLYFRALAEVPASIAGMFLNLTPVVGVSAAFLFLGERLAASQWIGAAMILAAVLCMFVRSDAEAKAA